MAGWTVATYLVYRRPPGRSAWMIAADILVAVVLVVSTRFIDTPARIDAGAPTLPVAWAAAPVLACAVAGGPWAGVAGALAVCAADFAERRTLLPSGTFNSAVLLLIAGGVGGWVVRLGLRAEATIERAARHQAAAIERERLARGIHDSVLQVLALVASRGSALGGEAAELGRLAGEQEAELRTLLTADASQPPPGTPGATEAGAPPGLADLRALIEGHAGDRVTVSCPATPVTVAVPVGDAIGGAVAAALDNTRLHAGPDARAWVLVEDEGARVRVIVRDDGAGFVNGRLPDAAAEGRLGVSHSIIGRLREVGGTAQVTSPPGGGTEVELSVSRGGEGTRAG